MSSHPEFDDLISQISLLYEEVNSIINENKGAEQLRNLYPKLNKIYSKLQLLSITPRRECNKKTLQNATAQQHVKKAEFDKSAAEYFKKNDCSIFDIASVVTAPTTFRSQQGANSRYSSASIHSRVKSIANQEITLLRVSLLEKRQQMEREKAERKRQLEMEEAERKRKLETEEAERKRQLEMEEAERKRKLEMEDAERRHRLEREEKEILY